MPQKLKVGDRVMVRTGKSKGQVGEIVRFVKPARRRTGTRVLVRGVNIVKKHVKPNPQMGITGGIEPREAPMDMSNVGLVNPETNKVERVRIAEVEEDGKTQHRRVFARSGKQVDNG